MIVKKLIPAICASFLAAPAAYAAIDLIAIGSLSGTFSDLASQTAGPLENGAAGNPLGGLGSGIAWAGGNTFIATPDRGPNATPYNSLVEDTTSYIVRFQTLHMNLTPAAPGSLPYTLTPVLTATTLLSSSTPLTYGTGALGTDATHTLGNGVPALNAINGTQYFTGRSDGFGAGSSASPSNARLDPEGVRVSNDGKSVFISDEYGPYVYQFDRATGQRIKSFALPANLAVTAPGPTTDSEGSPFNTSGRVANKGMEGLAITPDGTMLVGVMQAPLLQDTNKNVRIVTIDIASGATHEYAYKLTAGSGVSEIVALNNHQFLLDERDGKGLGDGSSATVKQLFKVDLDGAQDVSGMSGDLSSKAVSKTLFLDVADKLHASGIAFDQIPAKMEGLAFGQDVVIDGTTMHTLYVANDNDFVPGVAGDNKFYVFAVSDADLAAVGVTYTAQVISPIPEPETYALMLAGLALAGGIAHRRKLAGKI